jgi:hypothetical protein
MKGEIDMNGFKITNLGQNALNSGDAVNLQTLLSYFNQSRQIQSVTLSAQFHSTTVSAGDTPIIPGLLSGNPGTGSYQNQSNWEDYNDGVSIDGFRLGANNIPGLPTSAILKVSFRFTLNYTSSFMASTKLKVQDRRIAAPSPPIAETSIPIPANSTETFEMSLPIPYTDFQLSDFDNFIVSMILSVDQPVIVQCRLLALQYILSY